MTKEHLIELGIVAVVGLGAAYFVFTKPVSTPVTTNNSPESSVVQNGWQTVINNQIGFQFQYPRVLTLNENGCQIVEGKNWCGISFLGNNFYLILITNNPGSGGASVTNETQTNISIDGVKASLVIGDEQQLPGDGSLTGQRIVMANFTKDGNDFSFLARFPKDTNSQKNEELVKQILSTFRFTEDISNWKTYRNEEYGFEFKYPAGNTPFSFVNQEKETLVLATASDKNISIAVPEAQVFCCEPAILDVSIIDSNQNPRTWIDQNYQEYTNPEGIKSIESSDIGGKPAVILTGSGNLGSTYKLNVVDQGSYLIIINLNMRDNTIEKVLDSFTFK